LQPLFEVFDTCEANCAPYGAVGVKYDQNWHSLHGIFGRKRWLQIYVNDN